MSGSLDPDDPRPPYEQLAAVLRTAIENGELGPGARLPSYTKLSGDYGVAPNTVKSALAVLRVEGLIVSRQGKGSYVRTEPRRPDESGRTLADVWVALEATNDRLAELERRIGER